MAFETNTLVNGEWTRTTLDVNTVLKHYDEQDREATAKAPEAVKAPTLGILTQTVIRSPLVHWILPIVLRGPGFNDVAFVGEDFVQIRELRGDGFLWDVARRDNFGGRIRNARVVGSMQDYDQDRKALESATQIKDEDGDVAMGASRTPGSTHRKPSLLPPQFLVLQFDTGDTIFLMLQEHLSGNFELKVTTRRRVPRMMLNLQPGAHLSVDPNSRYMAVACSEGVFALYELATREQLKQNFTAGIDLNHVIVDALFPYAGVIHKMEFLHPSKDDDAVILLLLVVSKGKTRMVLLEWKSGDDIRKLHRPKAYSLGPEQQMPVLLIPLKFQTTFILVCEKDMYLCRDILIGNPSVKIFYSDAGKRDNPTALHHGVGCPIWAGWARPKRLQYHEAYRDDIYIAREDGKLKFLEIHHDSGVESDMDVGDFAGRCGTALACIDYRNYANTTGDLLITAGDSCAGGAYLVQGRSRPDLTQPIENWTPAQGLVKSSISQKQLSLASKQHGVFIPIPDKIYACVGKGSKGAIVEFRHGLEARIGLIMDYGQPITQAWPLHSSLRLVEESEESLFLVSSIESSVVLSMSKDESSIEVISNESVALDFRFQTIALETVGRSTIQVTRQSIVVIDGAQRQVYDSDQLCAVSPEWPSVGQGSTIHDVAMRENLIIFTTFVENATYLQLLDTDFESCGPPSNRQSERSPSIDNVPPLRTMNMFSTNVTSLAICCLEDTTLAIVAEDFDGVVSLSFTPVRNPQNRHVVEVASPTNNDNSGPIVSICVVSESPKRLDLLCGTRNGLLLTLEISYEPLRLSGIHYYRIGATSVMVKSDTQKDLITTLFAHCDSQVLALNPRALGCYDNLQIDRVWFTDALNAEFLQPSLTSLIGYISMAGNRHDKRMMVVAGSQLILASLDTRPRAVPRQMHIGGTPFRMLYSQTLDALIVAASVEGKSTILFIDPETGDNLSLPLEHKEGLKANFVSGLGNSNERIHQLFEWAYVKEDKIWNYLVASTNTGRVFIISMKEEPDRQVQTLEGFSEHGKGMGRRGKRSQISYYTRHKFRGAGPAYSVTGFQDGLLWCSGEKLYCEILDSDMKKFRRVAEYNLPSPANNLSFEDSMIYALTRSHSLEILQLVRSQSDRYEIVRRYSDQFTRYAIHHTSIEHTGGVPVHLISDKTNSIVGLWATKDAKADTLETIFEGKLPNSMLALQSAKCRPPWDTSWIKTLGHIDASLLPNPGTGMEVLGLSIYGSLMSFTILDFPAWNFLKFLMNLCVRSRSLCELSYTDDPWPLDNATEPKKMMHVDGDILKQCLNERRLEELLIIGGNTSEAEKRFSRFMELLQDLHRGELKAGASPKTYVEQAYTDLGIYLRPVL